MSVNSLIGKDDESENVKAIPQKISIKWWFHSGREGRVRTFIATPIPRSKQTYIDPFCFSIERIDSSAYKYTLIISIQVSSKQIEDQGLLALLGPNVTSFPFSEETFLNALKLRAEQERTKQEYYRVETANKNLAILQTALRAQMPVNMIPLLCVGNAPELTEEQMKMLIQQATFGTPSVLHPQQQVQQVQQHQQPLHFPTSQQQQQPQQQQQQQPLLNSTRTSAGTTNSNYTSKSKANATRIATKRWIILPGKSISEITYTRRKWWWCRFPTGHIQC